MTAMTSDSTAAEEHHSARLCHVGERTWVLGMGREFAQSCRLVFGFVHPLILSVTVVLSLLVAVRLSERGNEAAISRGSVAGQCSSVQCPVSKDVLLIH